MRALGSFYAGTWLNSPEHSPAGDAVVLVLAAVSSAVGTALGFAAGQHLANRRRSTPRLQVLGASPGGVSDRLPPRPTVRATPAPVVVIGPVAVTAAVDDAARPSRGTPPSTEKVSPSRRVVRVPVG